MPRISHEERKLQKTLKKIFFFKEIAANLNISLRTVETDIYRSKKRLSIYTKKELLTKCIVYDY